MINRRWNLPWSLGGDFNVIYFQEDQKEGDDNCRIRRNFNGIIQDLGSIDMLISDRLFT